MDTAYNFHSENPSPTNILYFYAEKISKLSKHDPGTQTGKELRYASNSKPRKLPIQFLKPPHSARERLIFYREFVKYFGSDNFGEDLKPESRAILGTHINDIFKTIKWGFDNEPEETVRIVEHITTFLGDIGRTEEQIEYCQKALEIAQAQKLRVSEIGLHARLGWNYILSGDYTAAEQQFDAAKSIIEGSSFSDNDTAMVDRRYIQVLRDLGHVYARQGNYADSLIYIQHSQERAAKFDDDLPKLQAAVFHAWTLCIKGENEDDNQSYLTAKPILEQSLEKLQSFPRQLTLALRLLGQIAAVENRFEEVRDYLDRATQTADQNYAKAQEHIELAVCWGNYYRRIEKDFVRALELYESACILALVWKMKKEVERARKLLEDTKREITGIHKLHTASIFDNINIVHNGNKVAAHDDLSMGEYPTVSSEEFSETSPLEKTREALDLFLDQLSILPDHDQKRIRLELHDKLGTYFPSKIAEYRPPLRPEVETAIEKTKEQIRNSYHGIQPITMLEEALDLFLEYGNGGIDFTSLSQEFDLDENDKKERDNALALMSRLAKKLQGSEPSCTLIRNIRYEIVTNAQIHPSSST